MTEAESQRIVEQHLNAGVLAYLGRSGRLPIVALAESHADPYWKAGSHPEVVDRIWDELGASTPAALRRLLHGTPALVLRSDGLVVAVALGTEYALRLAPPVFQQAVAAGATTEHHFTTVGFVLNLPSAFGDGWVFGSWHRDEAIWCASSWGT